MTKHIFPQGALERIILRAEPNHGWGITQKIPLITQDALNVAGGLL